jgi:hypothetical protein
MYAYKFGAEKLTVGGSSQLETLAPALRQLDLADADAAAALATPEKVSVHVSRHGSVDIRNGTLVTDQLAALS